MSVLVLGISGSPRKGATEYVLREGLEAINNIPEIETKFVTLRGKKINPCIHCDKCIRAKSGQCLVFDDDVNPIVEMWKKANAYLIASPVYSMGITPLMSSLFSRLRPLRPSLLAEKKEPKPKVGSAITVGGTRHGGQETAAGIINNLFLSKGILVAGGGGAYNGGTIWTANGDKNGAMLDEVGLETVRVIAIRLAKAAIFLEKGYSHI